MRKTMAMAAFGALLMAGTAAQSEVLTAGDNLVGGTVGLGFGGWNNSLTFGASYERGVVDEIFPEFNLGVGAIGSYTNFSTSFDYTVSWTFIGAQAVLHYDTGADSFLPYGGITLGFNTVNYSDDDISMSYGGGLTTGGLIGGRYYFADNMAANVRLTSGTGGYSVASVGVDYRF